MYHNKVYMYIYLLLEILRLVLYKYYEYKHEIILQSYRENNRGIIQWR